MKNEVIIHVVEIASLKAIVKESDCHLEVGTILMEEEVYCLELNALDREGNEILLTENLNIKVASQLLIFLF